MKVLNEWPKMNYQLRFIPKPASEKLDSGGYHTTGINLKIKGIMNNITSRI